MFEAKKLLEVVNGTELEPEEVGVAKTQWLGKHNLAKLFISSSINDNHLLKLVNCTTREMWARMIAKHQQNAREIEHILHQFFFKYNIITTKSILTHINRLEAMARQLNDLGEATSKTTVLTKVIFNLPTNYKHTVVVWDNLIEEQIDIKNS